MQIDRETDRKTDPTSRLDRLDRLDVLMDREIDRQTLCSTEVSCI